MKNSTPLISVIVAVRNGAETLQQCIDSVSQQSYADKELIIIDGASKDRTADLLKANNNKISYWISEPDLGIYNAWNKGLAKANGEWICFVGADDYFWDTKVLERLSEQLFNLPPNIRVAYGQVMIVTKNGKSLYRIGEPWDDVKEHFNQFMCIPHIGTMHRRNLFELHGKYDESFRISGDYELLLRELKTGTAFFIQVGVIAAMRIGGVSWSWANSMLVLCETRRALKTHDQYFPGFLTKAAKAYIKTILWNMFGERFTVKARDYYWSVISMLPFWTRIRNG